MKRRGARGAVALLFVATLIPLAPAGARPGGLPQADWGGAGRISWESGHLLSYGSSTPPDELSDPNQRRAVATEKALREASRNLYRLLLGLRVQDSLTVRDYLRQDPELQNAVRDELRELAPWQVRIGPDGTVQAAFLLPLGGRGGVAELLGDWRGGQGDSAVAVERGGGGRPGSAEGGAVTGVVVIAPGSELVPALRPRLLDEDGEILLAFGEAAGVAGERPAYVAYHESLEGALADPVVGENPLVVSVPPGRDRGTDIVLPRLVREVLAREEGGDAILAEVRIAVVVQ